MKEFLPDVAIIDIAMPGLNGIEATSSIVASGGQTSVMILSMHCDESYVLRALRSGACAYLLKDSPKGDLIARCVGWCWGIHISVQR